MGKPVGECFPMAFPVESGIFELKERVAEVVLII